jgi:hypothetical protein
MVPLAIVGLVAVVAILGWRGVKTEQKRVPQKPRRTKANNAPRGPITLEKDPETGVYKARDD